MKIRGNVVGTNMKPEKIADRIGGTGGGGSGKDGVTFTPSVSADGIISWTNDGGVPNPEPVNIKGKDGTDGYTPVKGGDYWTETDKAEMVADVIASLPIYNGEVV